jgi:ribonuclease-3
LFNDLLNKLYFFFRKKYFNDDLESTYLRSYSKLVKVLGFRPSNKSLFWKALTHSSYIEMNPLVTKSNERLEFLGDSVLNLIVAQYLFEIFPNEEEGFLTKSRATLVNRERLYNAAEDFGLEEMLLYNKSYIKDSAEGLQTIIADGLEAIIGAIYLDQGLNTAKIFIMKHIVSPFEEDESFLIDKNYKGKLLEYTHSQKLPSPKYIVFSETGPPHQREFVVNVFIGDELLGTGYGKSKKSAEQEASKIAMNKYSNNE